MRRIEGGDDLDDLNILSFHCIPLKRNKNKKYKQDHRMYYKEESFHDALERCSFANEIECYKK